MKSYGVTIQMEPLQEYFRMVLFIWYVVLTFESVDEILWCYHSNETSSAVISHGTIYLVCSSTFWVCGQNPIVLPFKWNLFGKTFTKNYLFLNILQKEIWGSLFWFFLRPVYTVHFTLQWTTLEFWTVWHRYFVISRGSSSPGLLQSTPLPFSEANTTGTRSSSSTPFPSSTGPLYQNEVKCSAFNMKMIFHSHANETHFHKKVCAVGLILKMRVLRTRKWPIN